MASDNGLPRALSGLVGVEINYILDQIFAVFLSESVRCEVIDRSELFRILMDQLDHILDNPDATLRRLALRVSLMFIKQFTNKLRHLQQVVDIEFVKNCRCVAKNLCQLITALRSFIESEGLVELKPCYNQCVILYTEHISLLDRYDIKQRLVNFKLYDDPSQLPAQTQNIY